MTPIAGGVFAAGGFANNMFSEVAGTPNKTLSQWLRLSPNPLGRPYSCLAARISQTDYYVPGGQNKYRSEASSDYRLLSWGQMYTYHWRLTVPPDWVSLGPGSAVIVMQMHDVNSGAVGRRPTFAAEIADGVIQLIFSRDSAPSGEVVYSAPVVAGQEFEFTIRVRWADGTNAPDASGIVEIFSVDESVYSLAGRNTWAGTALTEPNPPYLKCGVYQPGPGSSWWNGRAATMYFQAAFVIDGDYAPAQLRQWVDAQLRDNSNAPVTWIPTS